MKQLFLYGAIMTLLLSHLSLSADPGDTLVVQTYTFEEQNNPNTDYDSPGRRWFTLPEDDGTEYQKILMHYTLKCFEDGTAGGLGFDCGEWDYTTHTFLYEHTGVLDSNALEHPRYLANNSEFDYAEFSEEPLTNTFNYLFTETAITNVISEDNYLVNEIAAQTLAINSNAPFRAQFYFSPEELNTTGLVDIIQKLSLMFEGESTLSDFRISASWLEQAPNGLVSDDLTEVYHHPSFQVINGQMDFLLENNLVWDGISGLLIELTCEHSSADFQIMGSETGNGFIAADAGNSYILFDGEDQVQLPTEIFSSLDEEVTIGYWLYGTPEYQPENGTTFEGVNADNQRVLNVHNPWENGQVYWDAGQDGGYDRINAQASASEYEGQWNHWAFTKNTATGEMKIFLNGEEWLTGEDKYKSMSGITKFNIGSAAGWLNYYRGGVDDFFIIDKELQESDIQEYMNSSYSETLPESEHLIGYFDFEDSYGESVENKVSEYHGLSIGNAAFLEFSSSDLSQSQEANLKPWLILSSGEYETEEAEITYQVVEEIPPVSVVEYEVNGNEVFVSDYSALYPVGYSYVYDTDGNMQDSVSNAVNEPIAFENSTLNYFSPPFEVVNRIELGRFITPYGINLDLEEGWTWVYDVTDFEPLLRGEVELEAGNWQELLDLKFLFIEGTPSRDVKRVENIWAGNWQLSSWDEDVLEQTFSVEEGEEMFKVRATTSGHWFGQGNNCAEFCFNTHDFKINGNTEYSWEIMQECADNPLYPQGGTWIYDRAGWCPGAPVTTRELELTPYIGGSEFSVEYDIDYDPYGNYWLMAQLFSYGELNHNVDVDMTEIIAPSDFRINSRVNPICDDPIIRITNKGADPLTSVEIEFGVNGQMQTHSWSGNLEFMESEVVTLTYNQTADFYSGDDDEVMAFEVNLLSPNGESDENPSNNYGKSSFVRPPTYGYDEDEDDNRIIVETRTNNVPSETQVSLKTIFGATHWTSNYTQPNTIYRDTLTLNAGCWLLHIEDSGDDGLSFFANNDGSGYVRLKEVGGWYYESFEEDFGKEIKHYFNFETDIFSEVEEFEVEPSISVYPNPFSDSFYLRTNHMTGEMNINIHDASGKLVSVINARIKDDSDRIEIDLEEYSTGIYNVTVSTSLGNYSTRIVKN